MYGRHAIFQAKEDQGRKLVEILDSDSEVMKNSGAIIYSVSLEDGNEDVVHVYGVWPTKEEMVKSLSQKKVNNTVKEIKLLLKSPPISRNLVVRG